MESSCVSYSSLTILFGASFCWLALNHDLLIIVTSSVAFVETFSGFVFVNAPITFGLFALYVAIVSLVLVLVGHQDSLLALLRRFWGRTLGHSLYFGSRVALPMLLCVLCLGWGIRHYDATAFMQKVDTPIELNVKYYRDLKLAMLKEQVPDPVGVVYGA
jgi:hypothetical protein